MKRLIFLLLTVVMTAAPAGAKIAVFTDGRTLKVDDAFLEGDRIVLILPDSGRVVVPALRIDRVVADEIVPVDEPPAADLRTDCAFGWSDEPLPDDLPFADLIHDAARRADLNPVLLAALVRAESAFDPFAVSRVGATGLCQLMPAAAADRGVVDVFDPSQNLNGGARHLRILLDRFETLPLALAAYNAGATTVDRYGDIPPYRETRNYVRRIMNDYCGEQGT